MALPLFTKDIDNVKLAKSKDTKYLSIGLFLSPHKQNSRGRNLCPYASASCVRACLNTAGRAQVFPVVLEGRKRKTEIYLDNPRAFRETLAREIESNDRRAKKLKKKLIVRLNGTSDIDYPHEFFERFPSIQFYDYTKNPHRMRKFLSGTLPKNYYLTFSYSGENWADCKTFLDMGGTVTVVYSLPNFPKTYQGYKVIDGDKTDLRFLDPRGVIVGLKAKGLAKKAEIAGDFVIQIDKR